MIILFLLLILSAVYWVLRAEGLLPLSAKQQARVMQWLRDWKLFR